MTIFVLSAMSMSMRIGYTCSSIVTSVAECGITFPLIGQGGLRYKLFALKEVPPCHAKKTIPPDDSRDPTDLVADLWAY